MISLSLNFVAHGQFAGVRQFSADDGSPRRMWTVNYLGGKINGFLDGPDAEQIFKQLLEVPVGTAARAIGTVDATGDELRLVAESFDLEVMQGFQPLDDSEILRGCTFSGVLVCWRKEERRDGTFDLRFSGMGNNFLIRDVSKEIFDRVQHSQGCRVAGTLQTSLVYKGTSKIPAVGVRPVLENVKNINLLKKD